MIHQYAFEYVILRYYHDIVTGEFLNVGLAMYSRDARFFRASLLPRYSRITRTFPSADGIFYRNYIGHLQRKMDHISERISNKQTELFNEAPSKLAGILEQVLVRDSASVRFGETKGGRSEDLDSTFSELYSRLVEKHFQLDEKESRSDLDVWESYRPHLEKQKILSYLTKHVIDTPLDKFEFDFAWKNGKWNALQPVSFDLVRPGSITRKAKTWLGSAHLLSDAPDLSDVFILLGEPKTESELVMKAYSTAKLILKEEVNGFQLTLVEEDDAEEFAQKLLPKLAHDDP